MSGQKSILISGYYGFNNNGDDAILQAIIKDLRAVDNDISITVLSNDPQKTQKDYDVKAVDRFNIINVKDAIKKCSILINGGGSLLQDTTSSRSLFYYLMIIRMARFYKKPVIVYGNGIGPINKPFNRRITRQVLNKVNTISLRDEDSKDYLDDMKVNNKNIHVTADPAFTLKAIGHHKVIEIFRNEGIDNNKKLVGISIRKWNDSNKLKEAIGQLINHLLDKDINVILIPMHYPEDLDINREILSNVDRDGAYLLENKYNAEEIMGVISVLELMVGMRLHSLIYAASQSIPLVGISYDPKIEGFLKTLGVNEVLEVDNIESKDLINQVDHTWLCRQDIKYNLTCKTDALKEKALSNVELTMKLIGRVQYG